MDTSGGFFVCFYVNILGPKVSYKMNQTKPGKFRKQNNMSDIS